MSITGEEIAKSYSDRDTRHSRRFKVNWDLAVEWQDNGVGPFAETATLVNLGSGGAFFRASRVPDPPSKLRLRIRIPFNKETWMKFEAVVVCRREGGGVCVKFDRHRPEFFVPES